MSRPFAEVPDEADPGIPLIGVREAELKRAAA
jgi:hypothetical protein